MYGICYDMEELQIMNLLHALEYFTTEKIILDGIGGAVAK